jgi:tRNA pseudouridine synthase 10
MKLEERIIEVLREPVCDSCLGRTMGNLISGMSNAQRGRMARDYVAFLIDSGEKLNVHAPNFRGYRFRNARLQTEGPTRCEVCGGFFETGLDGMVKRAAAKVSDYEFSDFVVGSAPTDEMQNKEEALWNRIGIDYIEPIKSEINREAGKKLEKLTGKKFNLKDPDIVFFFDLKRDEILLQVKSLYISGGYQKLVRGIPQTRWVCMDCNGKGCVECKGEGKRYKTSVHEIVGKPAMKAAEGKDHAFHGAGREDIDARCLDYRPFVIEVIKPKRRKIDLRKIEKAINRSGKVRVSRLAFCDKETVVKTKSDRHDKTYTAEVEFEGKIDRKLLPKIKSLKGVTVMQRTPNRVAHRRADLIRKRGVLTRAGPRRP